MQPSPIGESRPCRSFAGEAGLAAALALTALSIFTLLGLFLALNATMEVRLTDNFEARVQAAYAARAGLRHAGELLSGVEFDDLLRGPDGTWDNSPAYTALARSYGFRNPIDWITARRLDIMNPLDILQGQSDDGLVNTGRYEVKNGTVLIPGIGIPLTAPDPYSAGGLTFARYFVKVSDNNGEAPEVAMDSADNPFLDGDGTIIVRSLGISPRIRETAGAAAQINAVAVYEARFKRHRTFDLQSALLVQGNEVVPSGSEMFSGNSFLISAGDDNFGLAVVDTAPGDGISPLQQIVSRLLPEQRPNIRGMERIPSVGDVTSSIQTDSDRALLLDAAYLGDFICCRLPRFADHVLPGNQKWTSEASPDLGSYDLTKQPGDPSQTPKITMVSGDLEIQGSASGAGILAIGGRWTGAGSLSFTGLILAMGAGEVDIRRLTLNLTGALYVVNLAEKSVGFGTPKLSIGPAVRVLLNKEAVRMSLRLIPPKQTSFREITTTTDPPEQ
ncbi:MAG: hypothetical protein DMG08_00780 [Acidobacteria bacterium]|nr:MAG: hypothetical protein DMG08_00780 [Acidobacteriota bacterium]